MPSLATFWRRPPKPPGFAACNPAAELRSLSHKYFEPQAGQIAEQLFAAYGNAAYPLVKEEALAALEQHDTDRFAIWCLVFAALEKSNPKFKSPGAGERGK
jgi:hypothetical protein